MIIYRHPLASTGTLSAPPWLDGAPSIVHSETQTHRLAGIGPDHQMGDRDTGWQAVGEHWEAQRVLPDLPIQLYRKLSWAKTRVVADAEGRNWQVPIVLTPQGSSAIIAVYGDDWLPAYTPQQQRLLLIADSAKAALESRELPAAAGCQWAAEALEAANYITVKVIQKCGMMDAHLAQNVLLALTGILDAAELMDSDHG